MGGRRHHLWGSAFLSTLLGKVGPTLFVSVRSPAALHPITGYPSDDCLM